MKNFSGFECGNCEPEHCVFNTEAEAIEAHKSRHETVDHDLQLRPTAGDFCDQCRMLYEGDDNELCKSCGLCKSGECCGCLTCELCYEPNDTAHVCQTCGTCLDCHKKLTADDCDEEIFTSPSPASEGKGEGHE